MAEIDVGFVEDDDFALAHEGAELPGLFGIAVTGAVYQNEAGKVRLKVETEMEFGGGFFAAMPRPVDAVVDELDRG